jgi:hypothetical protein
MSMGYLRVMKKIRTNVGVLDVSSRSLLGFDNFVCLFHKMLDEHFSCDGDYKGGIVRAALYVIIGMNDFLDACH